MFNHNVDLKKANAIFFILSKIDRNIQVIMHLFPIISMLQKMF